jgi:hypothetical protein
MTKFLKKSLLLSGYRQTTAAAAYRANHRTTENATAEDHQQRSL